MSSILKNRYFFPMIIMSVLFFMLGFITTLNNSLISFLGDAFRLNDFEKQLPNFAFFSAYAFSIPLAFLLKKLGYKTSAVLSLGVIGLGLLLCFPAVMFGYCSFLSAMFVVALGVTLLQIVLNPYVLALGSPDTAASRLNFCGTLNSIATIMAPLYVGFIITSISSGNTSFKNPEAVQWPFVGISFLAITICVIMYFLRLPDISQEESTEKCGVYKSSPYAYPHMYFGAFAIFAYMGMEIGIPSFLPDKIKALGLNLVPEKMLMLYWGCMLVGRLIGSFLLTKVRSRPALLVCVLAAALSLSMSFFTSGVLSLYFYIATGLFHSIMWGNIFDLGTKDLGPHTKTASGVICTAVIGGAILPPLMGWVEGVVIRTKSIAAGFSYEQVQNMSRLKTSMAESIDSGSNIANGAGVVEGLPSPVFESILTAGVSAAVCFIFVYYAYMLLFAAKLSRIRPTR